ncbi:MAG: hypothetical protein H2057_06290 [Alphaproteobacteria bacterium]|nr:hypothetical protein [Alphaproteobacteria bacterium]
MRKILFMYALTFVGCIQLSYAARAKCPDANTIQHSIVAGQHGYQVHKYAGTSTGARQIIFTNMDDRDTSPLRQPQDPAEAEAFGNQLACLYQGDGLALTTSDAGAVKDCHAIPGTPYFDCQ